MRRVGRAMAMALALVVVAGLFSPPQSARAFVPSGAYALAVGLPSSVLAAAAGGIPATGAQLANAAPFVELAAAGTAFAAPATKAAVLTKTVPGAPGMVLASYALGTFIGGGTLRMFGVDTQGIVCSSAEGAGQFALGLASGNDCAGWNITHPSYVPNQDQYPKLSSGAVCDAGTVTRCFTIIGSVTTVTQGVASTTACFKNVNYTGWNGLYNPLSPGVWKYFASGTLSSVYYSPGVAATSCKAMGANYYGGSKVWDYPGFVFAFYTGMYTGSIKTGSTYSSLTKTYPDPQRILRCEILGSDLLTYTADSATFVESGAQLPEVVCPGLPPGVFPLSQSVKEVGGGQNLTVLTQTTTDAYQDWMNAFPDCATGACELELFKNGESCWILDEQCDGWVADPWRDFDYTCKYGVMTVDIEECFIYGTTFNGAARDSGHGYADPATGLPVDTQTSPTLEDQIVAGLLEGWDVEGWGYQEPATFAVRREWARAVAKQCIALALLPGLSTLSRDCKTMPIFSPGVDIKEATQHDYDAIMGTQAQVGRTDWVQLDYLNSSETDLTQRSWYETDSRCGPYPSGSQACDEYPYWTSAQGGPGASLRMISGSDNSNEGIRLNGFVTVCLIKDAPMGSFERKFLVIPLPGPVAPPTTGWCSR